MSEENNFIDILRNELIHDISDREKAMLEDWSHSNDDNRSFRQLIREMKLSSEIEKKEEEMKSYILQEVHKRINRSRYIRRLLKISTVAASIAILLGMTGYFSYKEGFNQVNSQPIEMSNPFGMLSTITLPDGSKVILNAGTTITYPNAFVSKNREVEINGEAFFEVAHDAEHPFIVKANQINVEVLGTQFNVKAYEEDDWIEVSLSEGKVEVQSKDKKRRIFLSPGEQAYYDKHNHSLTTRTVDIAHYTSWRNGIYYFRALPLKEIVKQLERIFNVNICITSSNIEDIILTGDFLRGENLEQILRVITADKRLKYRIEEYMSYIDENKRTRKRIY